MSRSKFSDENLSLITQIMSNDTLSQGTKFYELEKLGFKLFDGSLGKKKRDALYVHKSTVTNEVKVQIESGFGTSNYARFVYFSS